MLQYIMLVTTVIVALEKANTWNNGRLFWDCSTRSDVAKTVQILGFRFCIQQMHKRNTPGTENQCFSSSGIAAVGVTAENFGTTLDLLKLSESSVETSCAWPEIIDCFGGKVDAVPYSPYPMFGPFHSEDAVRVIRSRSLLRFDGTSTGRWPRSCGRCYLWCPDRSTCDHEGPGI